jgi:2,4-dienoyl-CoA reductase (NADPH2)
MERDTVTSPELAPLLEPFELGTVVLKNRLVQSAMYSRYATSEGEVSERHLAYMVERARGGVGLITLENTCVDWETGRGSGAPIRIDEDRFVPGLNDLVEAVHAAGAKIAAQLYHAGRQSDHRVTLVRAGIATDLDAPLSASDVTSTAIGDRPRPMSVPEIDRMVERFAAAARRAVVAGFDAIEVHAVHGYLLTQFFSPQTNHRTDDYGGSIENRARFVRRVVQRIREVVGPDYPLLCRFSGDERVPGGAPVEENIQLAKWLAEDGIDAFHVSAGTYESREWIYTPAGVTPGSLVPLATAVKHATGKPVVGISRLGADLRLAARLVEEGAIDLVAMGRTQLADPQTVNKAIEGRWSDIRPCIACAECAREFIAKQRRMQCVVNPELGHEFRRLTAPARRPRRVVVVGGGPAGLEAARAGAARGHHVTLVESADRVGGQLRHAATGPAFHRSEMAALLAWWEHTLAEAGVEIRTGEPGAVDVVKALDPDQILLATGARWRVAPGLDRLFPGATTAHDVLVGGARPGGRVLVAGGTEAGLNAAMALVERGHEVTLVEEGPVAGAEISDLIRNHMLRIAGEAGLRTLTGVQVVSADGTVVSVAGHDGAVQEIRADAVVLTQNPEVPELADWYSAFPPGQLTVVGTAREPRGRLYRATQDGFRATAE